MSAVATAAPNARDTRTPMLIIGLLFFIFGFVTWLNGPLIQFVELAFDLNTVNAFLVLMVFYLSYFFLALPASWILRRSGMKRGMALGLFVMAVGAAVFGEFVVRRWYPGALSGLFVIGAGLALLQTAANPYISILGPIESAAQRIAFMGICNKIAGILAPLVIGALVMHGLGDLKAQVQAADAAGKAALLDAFAARVHVPYLVMACLLALLGFWIAKSPLPEIRAAEVNRASDDGRADAKGLFAYPHLWLGVLCLFVYVGVEVMAGDAIGTYGRGFGLPVDETKFFTSFTLAAMLVGYVVGLLTIPRFISQARYLALSAVLGALLSIGAFLSHGYVSVGFVAALGFANAMMWPAIFPLAIAGLGRLTETGSALLVMGIAGGAIIPQAFALLRERHDFQLVFVLIMLPCYLYILFYALRGYRAGRA
jgi:glucose/galactose transporter